jgi:hypothetical protein
MLCFLQEETRLIILRSLQVRDCAHLTKWLTVLEQIQRLRRESSVSHDFTIIWIPRRNLVSDQLLEEAGVLGDCTIHEYPLYFVPLSEDLLSLELQDAFSDLYLVRIQRHF